MKTEIEKRQKEESGETAPAITENGAATDAQTVPASVEVQS